MILETAIRRSFHLGKGSLMPRKKTIQPEPLESLTTKLDDGFLVEAEVRGPGCWEIGRGLHKRNALQELMDEILIHIIDWYVCSQGKLDPKKDVMKSATTLREYLEQHPDFADRIPGEGSFRKRIYPKIKDYLDILTNAIDKKNKEEPFATTSA
jgi:hypothetical protein